MHFKTPKACIQCNYALALAFWLTSKTMNTRLVWNFEIQKGNSLILPAMTNVINDDIHWESRFFWPESATIILHGLDDSFLELSRYKLKQREDTYYLLQNNDYNIKTRDEQLVYKPRIAQTAYAIGYGKKINLSAVNENQSLSDQRGITPLAITDLINVKGKKITVAKEALRYKFTTTPSARLELARITIANRHYFSLSLESKSAELVKSLRQQILGGKQPCDYVAFLKSL